MTIPAIVIETRKVKDLIPADYNPRRITPEALKGLKASIKRFGLVDLIIVNRQTGNVVGGHKRLVILIAENVEETQVVVVDLPLAEEKVLNVSLNNPHIQGTFTNDLVTMLDEMKEDLGEDYQELMLEPLEEFYDEEILEFDDDDETFNQSLWGMSHKIAVTFLFPKQHELLIKDRLRQDGKEYFVDYLLEEMKRCQEQAPK